MLPHSTKTISAITLLALLTANSAIAAYSELSCKLGLLQDFGWQVARTDTPPAIHHADACEPDSTPLFTYDTNVESNPVILERATRAIYSTTSRCLVNRSYLEGIKTAIVNLTDNKDFKFVSGGTDPRDPFIPPDNSWTPATDRGYDLPASSLSDSINALYKKPFIAECAAAAQIAQLAVLKEHYGVFTDAIIQPAEVGIGIWPEYVKAPSIAANKPLLLGAKQRKRALKELAVLGKGAFYNQGGYLRPYKGDNFVDSIDNRGQNFVIVELGDDAMTSMRTRPQPLKEFNRITRKVWKKYRKRMTRGGEDKEVLSVEMREELEKADPFFRDVMVYVHPLSVRNFAYHLARQFKWNPRTPYVFEMYEDFQSGYFYERYIDYRLHQCQQTAHCRQVDSNHFYLTDGSGLPDGHIYRSKHACDAALSQLSN